MTEQELTEIERMRDDLTRHPRPDEPSETETKEKLYQRMIEAIPWLVAAARQTFARVKGDYQASIEMISKATPLPWKWGYAAENVPQLEANIHYEDACPVLTAFVCDGCRKRGAKCLSPTDDDMAYIKLACNGFPSLLAEVARLRDKLNAAEYIIAWTGTGRDAEMIDKLNCVLLGRSAAEAAKAPTEITLEKQGNHRVSELLVRCKMAESNSEAIRKIKEGAVKIQNEKVTDYEQTIVVSEPMELRLGSHKVCLLKPPGEEAAKGEKTK